VDRKVVTDPRIGGHSRGEASVRCVFFGRQETLLMVGF
jgi:hypothetical protein